MQPCSVWHLLPTLPLRRAGPFARRLVRARRVRQGLRWAAEADGLPALGTLAQSCGASAGPGGKVLPAVLPRLLVREGFSIC